MANYAVIENGVVTNIIIAESLEIAKETTGLECVEYSPERAVTIGIEYDGTDFIIPELVSVQPEELEN